MSEAAGAIGIEGRIDKASPVPFYYQLRQLLDDPAEARAAHVAH